MDRTMIELPDVERMIDAFAGYATGKTVSLVLIDDPTTVQLDPDAVDEHIRGHAIDIVERHGKYVVLRFRSEVSLVFDMGSDGDVYLDSQTAPPRESSKIRLQFAAGRELRFAAPGTGGEVHLVENGDLSGFGLLENLGLDPLSEDLTAELLTDLARERGRSTLKGFLMNEEVVAGIGNEYADEICFQASIRPDCRVSDLSDDHLARVHKYLQRVLRRATLHWQAAHADPGWLINHRRPGHRCPRCEAELESLSLVGRRTYLCPRCQRAA
jgi:formamidopyrimidine-DNA glycosylase